MRTKRRDIHYFAELLESYDTLVSGSTDKGSKFVLKEIGQSIQNANKCGSAALKQIDIKSRSIENISQIPYYGDIQSSYFVAQELRDVITLEAYGEWQCSYMVSLKDVKLQVNIRIVGVSLRNKSENEDWVSKMINNILQIVFLMIKIGGIGIAKELNICYFDIDQPKLEPNKNQPYQPLHINSAYSTVYTTKPDVIIFRREEWKKVLIHELIHAFGIGLENHSVVMIDKHMHSSFNLTIDYNPIETYAESWARILITCLTAFSCADGNLKSFLEYAIIFLDLNGMYSIWNSNKVLNNWNLTYSMLVEKDEKVKNYSEKTAAFGYYVGSSLILSDWRGFLQLCQLNNKPIVRFRGGYRAIAMYSTFLLSRSKSEQYKILAGSLLHEKKIMKLSGIKMALFNGECHW